MAYNKKVILVDADDVLENLAEEWVAYLNERYGTHTVREDLKNWDVSLAFPTLTHKQVYDAALEEELYYRLKPLPEAPYYMQKLKEDGHQIYIVTNTPYRVARVKVEDVLLKYYPFLTEDDIIFTAHKQLVRGDILIDDGIHNLLEGPYEKILVSAPYNASFDAEAQGMIRTHNWKEIYETVCRIAGEKE